MTSEMRMTDWVSIAANLNLDPRQVSGGKHAIACPECKKRRKSTRTVLWPTGVISCYACNCNYSPKQWALDLAPGQVTQGEVYEVPKQPRPAGWLSEPAAVFDTIGSFHWRLKPILFRYLSQERGWPERWARALADTPSQVVQVIPEATAIVGASPIAAQTRRLANSVWGDAVPIHQCEPRRLALWLRDRDGAPIRPKLRHHTPPPYKAFKSLTLPNRALAATPREEVFGSIPAAVRAAKNGHRILVTEGGPDALALEAFVRLFEPGAAVLATNGASGAEKLATALRTKLLRACLTPKICWLPHRDTLTPTNPEGVGVQAARDGAAILADAAHVHIIHIPPHLRNEEGKADLGDVLLSGGERAFVDLLLNEEHREAVVKKGREGTPPHLIGAQLQTILADALQQREHATGLATPCGSGKTFAKYKVCREAHDAAPSSLRILVAKDRKAALIDADELADLHPVLLLGRKNLTRPDLKTASVWRPNVARDHNATPIDADTCGHHRAGQGVVFTCNDCSLYWRCLEGGGYAARRIETTMALSSGGTLIVTPQLLRPVLKEYLTEPHAAPIDFVFFDDVPTPGPSRLELDQLRSYAAARQPCEVLHAALCLLHDTLASVWQDNKPEGLNDEVSGHVVKAQSAHTHECADALLEAACHIGAPATLRGALTWLLKGRGDLGALVGHAPDDDEAAEEPRVGLEFFEESGYPIPAEVPIIIANASADPAVWAPLVGRPVKRIGVAAALSPSLKGHWLAQATFSKDRLTDPLDVWSEKIEVIKSDLQPQLEALAHRKGKALADVKVLVVTHKKMLTSEHWKLAARHLFSEVQSHTIHFRGADSVGSNDFTDFDSVVTLGDSRPHVGAWRRLERALCVWREGASLPVEKPDYTAATKGHAEQPHGRLRWLRRGDEELLLIHVGDSPGETLARISTPQRAVRPLGRPKRDVMSWLTAMNIRALSAKMAELHDAPGKTRLKEAAIESGWPQWKVKFKGQRGAPQAWWGPTEHDVKDAFLMVNEGARQEVVINPADAGDDEAGNYRRKVCIINKRTDFSAVIHSGVSEPSAAPPPTPNPDVVSCTQMPDSATESTTRRAAPAGPPPQPRAEALSEAEEALFESIDIDAIVTMMQSEAPVSHTEWLRPYDKPG